MSDYPNGALTDNSAPYNQSEHIEDLCKYCDHYDIEQMIDDSDMDSIEFQHEVDKLSNKATLCSNCLEEEKADFYRD